MFLDRFQEHFAMVRATGSHLLSAALCLLMPIASAAQDTAKKNSDTPSSKSSVVSTAKKPVLAEITRVSTDEAARSAAQKQAKKAAGGEAAEKSAEADVIEFQPAPKNTGSSGKTVVAPSKGSKKSALGKVHGEIYGSADTKDAGTHRAGASVGASSKTGKTAVYVEAERGRSQQDPRH
jgi:hypothetical protein